MISRPSTILTWPRRGNPRDDEAGGLCQVMKSGDTMRIAVDRHEREGVTLPCPFLGREMILWR